ncbi:enoyl-CoA hydratase-related protein [Streptomyces sp. SCSIO ZS0520]|uniref:enoyl-CoA hydratase-related protein n=1 Tax=Streptomyces sp. SCSIO ZS0520 TaxID=2892996 RepID=UPI0021DA0EEC|nr:enoyl-CoA hydratase-related protein [Streptomyces sp. SCSIO ZS0520]
MPKLERDGEVYVLHLTPDDENRFHPDWLAEVESALDEVEAAEGPKALVTAGSGKFWSNGLDLDWMGAHGDQATAYLDRVHALLSRTLVSPVVTVAALNGHTFAAGAMFALAHDLRVMRADRGYFCLPEVDLGLPFQRGMSDLIRARLSPATAHEAMTTGRRYGGQDALTAGIVEAAAPAEEVLGTAIALARPLAAKSTPARGQIKQTLYAETVASLAIPTR